MVSGVECTCGKHAASAEGPGEQLHACQAEEHRSHPSEEEDISLHQTCCGYKHVSGFQGKQGFDLMTQQSEWRSCEC